jgi:hypothetical protein
MQREQFFTSPSVPPLRNTYKIHYKYVIWVCVCQERNNNGECMVCVSGCNLCYLGMCVCQERNNNGEYVVCVSGYNQA